MSSSDKPPVPFRTESPEYQNAPKTLAERLDATQSGEEFGAVLGDLFAHLESTRHRGSGAPVRERQ